MLGLATQDAAAQQVTCGADCTCWEGKCLSTCGNRGGPEKYTCVPGVGSGVTYQCDCQCPITGCGKEEEM
jgi:hypothetical protein